MPGADRVRVGRTSVCKAPPPWAVYGPTARSSAETPPLHACAHWSVVTSVAVIGVERTFVMRFQPSLDPGAAPGVAAGRYGSRARRHARLRRGWRRCSGRPRSARERAAMRSASSGTHCCASDIGLVTPRAPPVSVLRARRATANRAQQGQSWLRLARDRLTGLGVLYVDSGYLASPWPPARAIVEGSAATTWSHHPPSPSGSGPRWRAFSNSTTAATPQNAAAATAGVQPSAKRERHQPVGRRTQRLHGHGPAAVPRPS